MPSVAFSLAGKDWCGQEKADGSLTVIQSAVKRSVDRARIAKFCNGLYRACIASSKYGRAALL